MKNKTNFWYYQIVTSFFLLLSPFAFSQDLAINEVMTSNNTVIDDEDSEYSDWIEIYNYGSSPVNMGGFGITDDLTSLYKWVFPAVTILPGDFMLVWASSKDRVVIGQPLHTNFKLSSSGEAIILTNSSGGMVDQVAAVELQPDVSYGRQPNGTGAWKFFYTSTPETSNIGTGLSELLLPPTFSHESGLYASNFNLSLTHLNPNVQIIYTLDGSEPDLGNLTGTAFNYKNDYPTQVGGSHGPLLTDSYTSNTYSSQINIYDKSSEPDQLASKNPRQHVQYVPINPVRKGFVIKAKAFVNGIGSTTVSKTFFVWSQGNPYGLPVISLQMQENHLFDYDDGIYTAGVDFDTWRANNPTNNQYYRPEWNNYWRDGELWEYPVNIELFASTPTTLNSVMNNNGGLRIHGNNSRAGAIKNLRIYARSEYDNNNMFQHDLFENRIPGTLAPNTDFKRMMLRGNGSGGPIAYDVAFSTAMQPIYNGVARIKPVVHFINGEFWGLTAIRDRIDDKHFALNFGLNDENIVIIDCKGSNCTLDEGVSADYADYIAMRDFITNNDMSNQSLYDQAASQLDMGSFIDHIVMEIYAANNSYERKYWKSRNPENNTFGDGKWRLSVQDFEASLKDNTNWLAYHTDLTGSPNGVFLANLVANEGFKIQFINRFADVLNTVFTTEYFNAVVNQVFDEVTPYLAEDINRYPRDDFFKQTEKNKLLNWGTTRHEIQQDQIKDHFTITEVLDFTLNVSDINAGYVKINTIDIKESTPGVTQNPYPWIGQYFHTIPVTLKAIALPGYTFSHWSGDVSGTNSTIEVTATSDMQIQANFDAIVTPREVVYFWLMDKDLPNDTPMENLSVTYASNSLNALLTYNSCLTGYPFTPASANWRKASLERKNAPTPLNYFPDANNNVSYANSEMRGVQVKQPFRSGTSQNNLVFDVPTKDIDNISFSVAVMSTGAAESMLIDYWDGSQWTSNNLINPSQIITSTYEVLDFDFSNVTIANNNSDFKIRMRFDGANMTVENGNEVIINNIVMSGSEILSTDIQSKLSTIKVYPNPTSNLLNIEGSSKLDAIAVFNIYGQEIYKAFPKESKSSINMASFAPGIYLIKVVSNNSEETVRVIKR
ncbi:T9SS type A sorting domain-containing protein [Brumimicrobium glaciale]|uniref:T9SS type A sorting domain-containing protein n=1 Tax=Brumimicrobium glaciale TaxID=200475 RepID=A0A4Q4KQS6_9FLAO|nr:CotH kinase family protein [Brumimicrobium glaciale]RYM35886.1 T9SS type A sorting domain-containing protein [Brumimicrobium glaciale]